MGKVISLEVYRCRKDPWYFAEKICGFRSAPYQRAILRTLGDTKRIEKAAKRLQELNDDTEA